MTVLIPIAAVIIAIAVMVAAGYGIRIMKEYERAVIFRFGRAIHAKGPGPIIIWPGMDRYLTVSLRTVTIDVPNQDVITKDNITVKVNAVVYFRVIDPVKAITQVEDYSFATSQLAQTALRSVLGQSQLDEMLANRENINLTIQKMIDTYTEPWGIKVTTVEIKNIDLPQEMQRAISRQAEAEREKRAKILHAEGELQAATKLAEAAKIINEQPAALQLRYLGTLSEIATEKNSTIIFPFPIDLLGKFLKQ